MRSLQSLQARLVRMVCDQFYRRTAKRVLHTAPLIPGTMDFTLLSMVQHRDVFSYLVALKSFHHQAPARRIVVVCDPSLNEEDRQTLSCHAPGLELRDAHEFSHPDIPRGGCWERLYAISHYAQQDYVVQLDADTLTLGALPEVVQAIRNRCGFVIGERADQSIEPIQTTVDRAQSWLDESPPATHIQAVVEASLGSAGLSAKKRYARGCAAFTGFPPNLNLREDLLEFSRQMRALHGERWAEWGTEQVASNYLVANAQGTVVLPFPRYGTPDQVIPDTAFLHFIGYLRFVNRRYEYLSGQSIAALPRA